MPARLDSVYAGTVVPPMDAVERECPTPRRVPWVIHLVVSLAHGGLERCVVNWTHARNRRWPGSTMIVCLDEPGDLASQVEGNPVIYLHADRSRRPWDRQAVATLRGWCRGQRTEVRGQKSEVRGQKSEVRGQGTESPIDHEPSTINHVPLPSILHAHNLAAWQYAVLSAWGTGVRTVFTLHGENTHNQTVKDRLRARLLAFLTDELVAVSGATARSMSRSLWIPRSGIRVVANGVEVGGGRWEAGGVPNAQQSTPSAQPSPPVVDVSQCGADVPVRLAREGADPRFLSRSNIRRGLGIPEDAIAIGSVGRLAHVKGYDRLVTATSHLPPPACSLLLIGDGPEREHLERLAAELGVADRVRIAGFQADPRAWLKALDLFVLPSRSEGVSMGLLQAMDAGIPVAVTDVGANREVIDDGACGFLLPEDESLWPAVLRAAWEDPGRLESMKERARCRVRDHYSMRATLAGYETLYNRLAATGRRGGCGDDCACGKK